MTSKEKVLKAYPEARCAHVPMSIAVAIYVGWKMIGAESLDPIGAWNSAAECLPAAPEVPRESR